MVDLDPRAYLPGLNISGGFMLGILLWFFIILVVSGIGVGFVIWYYRNKKFFIKINIFEKVAGVWTATRKDRAMETRLSNDGTVIHYWRKHKAFRPMPTLQSGVNTYFYFIREDGHYINFTLGDLDEQMRELGAHFHEKDVRYQNIGLRKSLKDRYDAPTFMQKYGGLITYVVLIVVTMIMIIMLFDKFLTLTGGVQKILETAPEILDQYENLLATMNNVCGGSGIVPAA